MNTSIILKNTTTNNVRKSFINLMQYAIKKGNKNKIENIFRSLLFYIIKNPNLQNNFNFNDIFNAISNTSPKMSVKTKRKGSKNIYIPITITENHSKYLSSN
jgi:ribosomal protein S7